MTASMRALRTERLPSLERLIRAGLIVLVALMPLHAFLSVWLGTATGQRTYVQSWKEVLLVVLAGLGVMLVLRRAAVRQRLRQPVVVVAVAFIIVSVLVTLVTRPPLATVVYGLKFECEFLVAFILAALVAETGFFQRLIKVALASSAVVVAFGLLQVSVLPPDFLVRFGYGPDTIAPYQHLGPDVSALRFASTLGGPNQLGTYLIILIALATAILWRRRRWWASALLVGAVIVLIYTYSRGAWIGAGVGLGALAMMFLPNSGRRIAWITVAAGAALLVVLAPMLSRNSFVQHYLLHGYASFSEGRGSDYEHLDSLRAGAGAVASAPLGHGLGSAGPAVFFTGNGRIIEDYYLQIGYESGWAGASLFIGLLVIVAVALWQRRSTQSMALAAALFGISVNALVLPVWTDSTTALTFWTLVGAAMSTGAGRSRTPEEPAHV